MNKCNIPYNDGNTAPMVSFGSISSIISLNYYFYIHFRFRVRRKKLFLSCSPYFFWTRRSVRSIRRDSL